MTRRRLPRWSEIRPLVTAGTAQRHRGEDLAHVRTVEDMRRLASRRTPRAVFDYVDGAAEAEISLARARAAFRDLEFLPEVLRDVSTVGLNTTILGAPAATPVVLAPTGFTRMMHHAGESAVVRAANRHGAVYTLSTMGTTSIEQVAEVSPTARKWFQLYVWRDRGAGADLLARAHAAGYEALMVTVDVPVAGARLRDVRNGLTIPPSLTPRTLANMSRHPRWWLNLLTTEPLEFASLSNWKGTVADLLDDLFDPTMTESDLDWVREHWPGPLLVKGVQTVADAKRMMDAGVDGIVLSNHGGRQLDRAPVPLRLLPDVREALGERTELYVDTGVMSGGDIVAALALGADAVLVGRAYLYGLMAYGERGVDRVLGILHEEMARTMRLLGVDRVGKLDERHVVLHGGRASERPPIRASFKPMARRRPAIAQQTKSPYEER